MKNLCTNSFIFIFVAILLTTAISGCVFRKTPCWEKSFAKALRSGKYRGLLFPDWNANYWTYTFEPSQESNTKGSVGLKISGNFAYARYQSIILYDTETGNVIRTTPNSDECLKKNDGVLLDRCIEPNKGSQNPYRRNVDRNVVNRSYTIAIIPEGCNEIGITDMSNIVRFPAHMKSITIIYRVYLPDIGLEQNEMFLSGGVPLPTVEPIYTATGEIAPSLKGFSISLRSLLKGNGKRNRPVQKDGITRFFKIKGAGLFPNPHNKYLVTFFNDNKDSVAVIKFKPPTFKDTIKGGNIFNQEEDVRYWSLTLGGKYSFTSKSLADYQLTVARDGYVYLVIGPNNADVKRKAQGLNFIEWGKHKNPLLIYRNLVKSRGFTERINFSDIPVFTAQKPIEEQSSDRFLGNYAPIGIQCNVEEFLKNYCGFEVDFP